jgi:hypothetical protein
MENEEINRKLDLIIEEMEINEWPNEWVTGVVIIAIMLIAVVLF